MRMTSQEFMIHLLRDKQARTNQQNTGKAFEREIETTCEELERLGLAKIKKADPPVKVMGSDANRRVIFLENPFLDFVGSYRKADGSWHPVQFECKQTSEPKLAVGVKSGGVTEKQLNALLSWAGHGWNVFVFWKHGSRVKRIGVDDLEKVVREARKHMKFEELHVEIYPGPGFLLWDLFH